MEGFLTEATVSAQLSNEAARRMAVMKMQRPVGDMKPF